jgi:steroid delta-isomerase-like uncharacterized protein
MGDFVMSKNTKLFLSLIVLVVVVVFFFYSPMTNQPTQDEVCIELKAKILAIWNDSNLDAIPETFTEDCVHHHSSLPEPITSHEAYAQFVKNNDAAFSDFVLTLSDFYVAGDMTFLFWEGTGTNDGAFEDGSPPTGKTISIWGMAANRIVDGKIAESWVAFNQYDMFRQMGMFGETEEASMDPLPDTASSN